MPETLNISAEDEKTVREIFIRGIRESGLPIAVQIISVEMPDLFTVLHVDKKEKLNFYGEVLCISPDGEQGLEKLSTVDLSWLVFDGVHKKDKASWKLIKENIKEAKDREKEI